MDEDECKNAIELYQKLENGQINEWEIAGDEYTKVVWGMGMCWGWSTHKLAIIILT